MTPFVRRPLPSDAGDDPLFVRATARTMAVLSAFHEADHPLSLSDIARRSGLDRSTAQRIVHTLRKLGYLRRDPHDQGYVPGLRIYDHIFDTMRLDGMIQRAVPLLTDLRQAVNERVDLSLIDDTRLIYAARLPPRREVLHGLMVGLSVPIHCTSGGWAVLSHLPEDEARAIINRCDRRPVTHATLTDPDAIMERLRQGRRQGYCMALEQLLPGEIGIATAIRNRDGRPVAAITVTGIRSDWTPDAFEHAVAPALMQTAAALSRG